MQVAPARTPGHKQAQCTCAPSESETTVLCVVGKPDFSQSHSFYLTGQLAGEPGDTAPVLCSHLQLLKWPARPLLLALSSPGEALVPAFL